MSRLQKTAREGIDRIEAEMKKIGMWQEQPLAPELMNFTRAFGMDTMAFPQWLQFVFVPRVREAIESDRFPRGSQVGAQAIRELDGDDRAQGLVSMLCEFDALFE